MKQLLAPGLALVVVLAGACRPKPAALLTVADVQKVTGRSGIRAVTRAAGAEDSTNDLRFAGADGRVILTVSVQPANALDRLKAEPMYFRGPIKGIGEEAFEGPRFGFPMYLYFRKGNAVVALLTYADPDSREDAPLLQWEQLTALARIALARM